MKKLMLLLSIMMSCALQGDNRKVQVFVGGMVGPEVLLQQAVPPQQGRPRGILEGVLGGVFAGVFGGRMLGRYHR